MERGRFFSAGAQGSVTTAGFRNPKDDAPAEDVAGRLSSKPREVEIIVDIVCSSEIKSL